MNRIELEEFLRLVALSTVSAVAGVASFWVGLALQARANDPSPLLAYIVAASSLYAWLVCVCVTLISGLVLHLIIRRRTLSRTFLLPLFVAVALVVWWAFIRSWVPVPGTEAIAIVSAVVSWAGYCYGPFALWQFKFDPASHSEV